jgi:hypothetical protein
LPSWKGSPVSNRSIGLNYIYNENYEVAIFGDIDDFFQNNRIAVSLSKLKSVDIVVNDLNTFINGETSETNYLSERLQNNYMIDPSYVMKKNIFGLSNTAIKVNSIFSYSFPKNIIAFDWYFFTLCLLDGYKALFTNETSTYYRMHENNIVGLGNTSKESFINTLEIKSKHFHALKEKYPQYNDQYLCVINLLKKLQNSIYFDNLEPIQINYPLWWENTYSIQGEE